MPRGKPGGKRATITDYHNALRGIAREKTDISIIGGFSKEGIHKSLSIPAICKNRRGTMIPRRGRITRYNRRARVNTRDIIRAIITSGDKDKTISSSGTCNSPFNLPKYWKGKIYP